MTSSLQSFERSESPVDYDGIISLGKAASALGIELQETRLDKLAVMFEARFETIEHKQSRGDDSDEAIYYTRELLLEVPTPLLNEIYQTEDSSLRDRLLQFTELPPDAEDADDAREEREQWIICRSRLLGYKDSIEYIVDSRGDESETALLAQYDINPNDNPRIVLSDHPDSSGEGRELTPAQLREEIYDFSRRYLRDVCQFSDALSKAISKNSKLFKSSDCKDYKKTKYLDELEVISDLRSSFSSGELETIYQGTGIINFGNYSDQQLKRMQNFAEKDDATLDELHHRPVIVVVCDGFSDNPTAFNNVAYNFEGDSATTLYFEYGTALDDGIDDLSTYATALAERSVTYDTIVLGSHGKIGTKTQSSSFKVGDTRISDGVEPYKKGERLVDDVFEVAGLQQLFKGLCADERGEATIVLQSCMQASRDNRLGISMLESIVDMASTNGDQTAEYIAYGLESSSNFMRGSYWILDSFPETVSTGIASARITHQGVSTYRHHGDRFYLRGLMSAEKRKSLFAVIK